MEKVWLKRYPADVPAEIDPDRFASLAEMLENAVANYADQPAFINMGEVMTYRKLEERQTCPFFQYCHQQVDTVIV